MKEMADQGVHLLSFFFSNISVQNKSNPMECADVEHCMSIRLVLESME